MKDVQINTVIRDSAANGLFNEIEELKKKRRACEETIADKTHELLQHVKEHGKVLAYKNDEPYIVRAKISSRRTLDKARLADDTEKSQSDLNPVGIARLVEEKRLTSKQLEEYYVSETSEALNAKKASKSDIELLFSK